MNSGAKGRVSILVAQTLSDFSVESYWGFFLESPPWWCACVDGVGLVRVSCSLSLSFCLSVSLSLSFSFSLSLARSLALFTGGVSSARLDGSGLRRWRAGIVSRWCGGCVLYGF